MTPRIFTIIPAFNEQEAIGKVIQEIPANVTEIVVVDNRSTDATYEQAIAHGVTVLKESNPGYGYACLKGIDYLLQSSLSENDIVVFLDGDHSDFPDQLNDLIRPILKEDFDLVIGSRTLGKREKGALLIHQRFGNWLAISLIKVFYKVSYTDLGPFRAVKWSALKKIDMQDKTYGWTVEMQVKAAKFNLKTTEIPVNYRKRIGRSKISGTIQGTFKAGYKILSTIFRHLLN